MEEKITPMMQQWHACKAKAKEALLLFRLGDFYEAFHEDAVLLSKELEVTLTKRADIPMSGIPAHTIENYIEKLLHKGHLIAIAEQVEDPKQAKGIVKREIVRLISPGAVYSPSLLSDKANNFFACLTMINSRYALAVLDLTTAQCKTVEVDSFHEMQNELFRLAPSELLLSDKCAKTHPDFILNLQQEASIRLTIKPSHHFEHQTCSDFLIHHFKVHNLDGFGLKGLTCAINASGALLCHMQEDLSLSIAHITSIETYHLGLYMSIDQITQKHLDLFVSQNNKKQGGSLLYLLDHTTTPMGGRLLREWILHPLLSTTLINQRLEATEELLNSPYTLTLTTSLKSIKDIERLILRITTGFSSPRDIIALKNSLKHLPELSLNLCKLSHPLFKEIYASFEDLSSLTEKIDQTLVEEPPIKLSEGNLIKEGVNADLDELKKLKAHSEDFLITYQEKLKEETGIKTLKVGFSRAFGYFIDISRGQASKVPSYFHKRQTLVNNERYITEELRDYENKILHAEEKILSIEQSLYQELKSFICSFESPIRKISKGLAYLDCLLSLYHIAKRKNYVKPLVDESSTLSILEGRHPILELSDLTHSFIPNDTLMNDTDQKLFVITGPNMAGKSTYIRQVALICIMTQIGCFVPAKQAHIGLIDKVFSRIGANDDLSRGQSTFMVEMTETANILRHATKKSLVILDEIGRGTSTYDGISIAWAVAQYLLTCPEKSAKTLFATHYCELIELQEKFYGAINYHIAVKESDQGIIFLRKIMKGGTDKSYGIHVAKLAGLPAEVIQKASEMLKSLEAKESKLSSKKLSSKTDPNQFLLFESPQIPSSTTKVIEELKKISINQTTPIQALSILEQLQSYINN